MEVFDDVCSQEDLMKFKRVFNQQKLIGPVSHKAQFEYGWCLVRSQSKTDIKLGVLLLQDLYKKSPDDLAKRDYLYYSAFGCCKLKDYQLAKKFVDAILQVQPGNHQAEQLRKYIDNELKHDGLLGMAIVGGAAVVGIGALVGIGAALARK